MYFKKVSTFVQRNGISFKQRRLKGVGGKEGHPPWKTGGHPPLENWGNVPPGKIKSTRRERRSTFYPFNFDFQEEFFKKITEAQRQLFTQNCSIIHTFTIFYLHQLVMIWHKIGQIQIQIFNCPPPSPALVTHWPLDCYIVKD